MNRKQYLLLVALTIVAGLIGGAVSNWVWGVRAAMAQDSQVREKVVKAERFELVNAEDRTCGAFMVSSDGYPEIVLFDSEGSTRMRLRVSKELPEDKEAMEILELEGETAESILRRQTFLAFCPEMTRLSIYDKYGQLSIQVLDTGLFRYEGGKRVRPVWSAVIAGSWGGEFAGLTKSEYLEMQFQSALNHAESRDSSNSFSTATFYPTYNSSTAIVIVIQAWNDEAFRTAPEELRRHIREMGSIVLRLFKALCESSAIQKRWVVNDPEKRIIIKHVRARDTEEILAVTIDGITSFDKVDFEKAKAIIEEAGGIWRF